MLRSVFIPGVSRHFHLFLLLLSFSMALSPIQGFSPGARQKIPGHLNMVDTCNSRKEFIGGCAGAILAPLVATPIKVDSLSPEQAEKNYNSYASSYDNLDGGKATTALGIEEARVSLFGKARGRVLDVAAGTGLNIFAYDLSKITSLTLVDISEGMLSEAKKRVEAIDAFGNIPIEYIKADATSDLVDLFGPKSFDTVVDSFSLW